MPRDSGRARRVADSIQRELAGIVRQDVKDPRVRRVTLTDVEVTPDLAHARIYFTLLGSLDELRTCALALQRASGFLRSELSRRMMLRHVPDLTFIADESVERGVRLVNLIDRANAAPAEAGEQGGTRPTPDDSGNGKQDTSGE